MVLGIPRENSAMGERIPGKLEDPLAYDGKARPSEEDTARGLFATSCGEVPGGKSLGRDSD